MDMRKSGSRNRKSHSIYYIRAPNIFNDFQIWLFSFLYRIPDCFVV